MEIDHSEYAVATTDFVPADTRSVVVELSRGATCELQAVDANSGLALAVASAECWRGSDQHRARRGRIVSDGRAELLGLEPRKKYRGTVETADGRCGVFVFRAPDASSSAKCAIAVPVSAARLVTGRVVDAMDGHPIAGARIEINRYAEGQIVARPIPGGGVEIDRESEHTFAALDTLASDALGRFQVRLVDGSHAWSVVRPFADRQTAQGVIVVDSDGVTGNVLRVPRINGE